MTGSAATAPAADAPSNDAWLVAAAARSADELLAALAARDGYSERAAVVVELSLAVGRRLGLGEIPLTSRVVMVSDAYHAMTSERPYRAAMSPEEARAEL